MAKKKAVKPDPVASAPGETEDTPAPVKKASKKKAAKKKAAKKKTTKKKAAPKVAAKSDSTPSLDLFVVCDSVTKDPQTGKHTLIGVFDQVTATQFPARVPTFATYAKISGGEGSHKITFEVRGTDDQPLQNTKFDAVEIKCENDRRTEITVNIANLQFPEAGRYQFLLKSGDETIGNPVFLTVSEANKPS